MHGSAATTIPGGSCTASRPSWAAWNMGRPELAARPFPDAAPALAPLPLLALVLCMLVVCVYFQLNSCYRLHFFSADFGLDLAATSFQLIAAELLGDLSTLAVRSLGFSPFPAIFHFGMETRNTCYLA